ncbi:MAG: glycosidase [Acidobacteriota bacterium]
MRSSERGLITRHPGNPILTPDDVPYPVETVHNAGAVRHGDEIVLLFRAHRRSGRSVLGLARSRDGISFTVDPAPLLEPAQESPFREYEEFGVEDPRITALEGRYWITYSAYSRHGVRIALARTTDFREIERVALISQADMRNVALFPERIGGRYARLDRPHSEIAPWSIWISFSPDLVHWGDARRIIAPAPYHWDEMKVGPGAPPVRTDQGWLVIYHGVFRTMDGAVYRLGAALLDLEDPTKVIGVADDWILAPEDPWELTGYVHNVVFTCGAVEEPGGILRLYWGGADQVICTGTARIDDLVGLCVARPRPALGGA